MKNRLDSNFEGIGTKPHYARALYDYGHGGVMVAHAVDELKGATSKGVVAY